MKRKKLLVILMTLSMLTSFTACGNNDDVQGEIKNDTQAASGENNDTEETAELSLGKSEGSTYESTFMGLGWTLPEGWSFLTQEQRNNITADMTDDEEIASQLSEADVICDMYAINMTTGDSVNIQLENLNAMGALLYGENEYVDASMPQLQTTMESSGYTDLQSAKTTVNVAGTDHAGISLSCSYEGVTLYEKIACIKVGRYMCVVTAASATESAVDSILANFYALEQ